MSPKWPQSLFSDVLQPVRRAERLSPDTIYRTVGVKWYAEGLFHRDPLPGRDIKAKELYRLTVGDLVYNRLFAWKGSFAIAEYEHDGCYVSGEFPCFVIDKAKAHPKFIRWFTATSSFWQSVVDLSTGASRQSRLRLKEERFLAMALPLPAMHVQERIVEKIEAVSARAAEATRMRESVESERDKMLLACARELAKDAPRRPLQEVAPLTRRPVEIDKQGVYHELGVRSFGRGTFRKPDVLGAEWTWQRPYWMKRGDLLFSNIKAWEGAVAVIPDELDAFVGSHRYITCRAIESVVTPEFLCQWFLTPEGLKHLGGSSPGATDRNRTLGLKKLMAIPVPVPPLERQKTLSELCNKVAASRQIQDHVSDELKSIMPALLDRAFSADL